MKSVNDCTSCYYKDKGYNCSETVLSAACEAWELDMPQETVKTMAGFGGGMGMRYVCGGVIGGVAALSCKYVTENAHKSPLLMPKVRLFIKTVRERLGDDLCSVLNPKYATKEERCLPTIRLIAEILDEVDKSELN